MARVVGMRFDEALRKAEREGELDLANVVALLEARDDEARALVLQVKGKDYSPPRRERILEWQRQQEFAICPEPDNPDACNIYKDLKFPPEVYEHIGGYYEQKAESKS